MIGLAIRLAVVGFVIYALVTYIPMPEPIRIGIVAIVVLILIVYLLQVFGIADIPIPRFN